MIVSHGIAAAILRPPPFCDALHKLRLNLTETKPVVIADEQRPCVIAYSSYAKQPLVLLNSGLMTVMPAGDAFGVLQH